MRRLVGEAIVVGVLLMFGGQALTAEDAAAPAPAPDPAAPAAPAPAAPVPAAAPAPAATPAPAAPPAPSAAPADDLAALIAKVAPPERYKDHVPNFSAKEEEFEFQLIAEKSPAEKAAGAAFFSIKPAEKDKPAAKGKPAVRGKAEDTPSERAGAAESAGPQAGKAKLWIVRDGPRVVAVYHPKASKLYVVAPDPAKAGEKLDLPRDYNDSGVTFDGVLGVRLTTFPPCYGAVQSGEHEFVFTPGKKNATLALVDTTRWPGRKGAEAVYALTLRCDPVLGYAIECDASLKADAAKDAAGKALEPELLSFFPDHVYMYKWKDATWRYEYTVYAPAGDAARPVEGRFIGWVNDFGQSDRATGLRLRSGGLVLYATDPGGGGPAVVATAGEGALLKNDTGNLQYDQHFRATLPARPDAGGAYGVKVKFRYANLPPEVVRQVMEQMEVTDWRGTAAVPVRVGRVEGAEDAEALLKASLVYKDVPTTDREHHSGTKSLVLLGDRRLRLDPVPPLDPGATYRLEAWVKVTGRGGQARVAAEPAKWFPKGTEPAQQMSATVKTDVGLQKTDRGWQQVVMTFASGPCGSTPWLYLAVSPTGTAYLDDVSIVKVNKTSALSRIN